jgi:hypothetical protein
MRVRVVPAATALAVGPPQGWLERAAQTTSRSGGRTLALLLCAMGPAWASEEIDSGSPRYTQYSEYLTTEYLDDSGLAYTEEPEVRPSPEPTKEASLCGTQVLPAGLWVAVGLLLLAGRRFATDAPAVRRAGRSPDR